MDVLIGDSRKAQKKLRWKPKVSFKELVRLMVDADMEKEELKLNGYANYQRLEDYVIP